MYGVDGFNLCAFPCNQFGGQAPLSDEGERSYAYEKFGFKFDVFVSDDLLMDITFGYKIFNPSPIEFVVFVDCVSTRQDTCLNVLSFRERGTRYGNNC